MVKDIMKETLNELDKATCSCSNFWLSERQDLPVEHSREVLLDETFIVRKGLLNLNVLWEL